MSSTNSSHILLIPLMAWGHTRPMCVLASRLVTERDDIVITFLASPNTYDKTITEITRQFPSGSGDKRFQRIRVASPFHSDEPDVLKLFPPFNESYPSFYQALSSERSVTCASSGTVFPSVPAPRVVILDFFAIGHLHTMRAIMGRDVPVIAWMSGNSSSCLRLFGPESYGGLGDIFTKLEAEAARTNKPIDEVADIMTRSFMGAVIKVPGIPPMYDYERMPQDRVIKGSVLPLLKAGHSFLKECDGALLTSTNLYDKEGIDTFQRWYNEDSRKVFVVGPSLPDPSLESDVGHNNSDVSKFLQTAVDRYGKRSVVYISFGSILWPASADYLHEVIEALIEKRFPFILCTSSPLAILSDELRIKIESSGLGIIMKWAPQQYILSHPATGWFISHCGHGSVMESLQNGIPMICWPFDADQPDAAAHLSQNLKVAFEPLEVKNFVGKPSYRSGKAPQGSRAAVGIEIREILEKCRGKEGEEMRRNAETLKLKFLAAWSANGAAREGLRAFLIAYL